MSHTAVWLGRFEYEPHGCVAVLEMNRVVVLMGNLGAGKTTVGKLLEAKGWTRLVIDDFRITNTESEYHARNALLKAIHDACGNIVYETTCANAIHRKAMLAIELKGCTVTRVMLNVSEQVSAMRHGGVSPWGKTHAESFGYIEKYLRREWADLVFDMDIEPHDRVALRIFDYICL